MTESSKIEGFVNTRSLQPSFKITLNGVDITGSVSGEVVYEETFDNLNTLSFSVSGRKYFYRNTTQTSANGTGDIEKYTEQDIRTSNLVISLISFGAVVEMWGGTLDTTNYKKFFKGRVKKISQNYDESGWLSVGLNCSGTYDYDKDPVTLSFPSDNNEFIPKGTKIKTTKVVEALVAALIKSGHKVCIEVNKPDVDFEFTEKIPFVVYRQGLLTALQKLAVRVNCVVSYNYNTEADITEIYFEGGNSFRKDDAGSIAIPTPLKDGVPLSFYHPIRSNDYSFQYDELNPGEVTVWGLSVEQDLSYFLKPHRVQTGFDYETGEDLMVFELVAESEEELKQFQEKLKNRKDDNGESAEVKFSKVESKGKTVWKAYFRYDFIQNEYNKLNQEQKNQAEQIFKDLASPDSQYTIKDVYQYFQQAEFDDNRIAIRDTTWIGIQVQFTTDGNINIFNKKFYGVRGIGRYGTDSLQSKMMMRTVRHKWSEEGYLTECELIV